MPDKGFELKLSDADMSELVRVRRERDMLLVSHAPAAGITAMLGVRPSGSEGCTSKVSTALCGTWSGAFRMVMVGAV